MRNKIVSNMQTAAASEAIEAAAAAGTNVRTRPIRMIAYRCTQTQTQCTTCCKLEGFHLSSNLLKKDLEIL